MLKKFTSTIIIRYYNDNFSQLNAEENTREVLVTAPETRKQDYLQMSYKWTGHLVS